MKLSEFIRHRKALYSSRQSIEIVSGPGVGKSTTVRAIAALLSKDYARPFGLHVRILSGIDAADVKGFNMPMVDQKTGALLSRFSKPPIFPEAGVVEVYEHGERVTDPARLKAVGVPRRGILFLDEYGQADSDVQKVTCELLLERHINEYFLPEDWTVWCASNRVQDKAGVVKRLSLARNRMATYEIQHDVDGWEKWCIRNGVHPLIITFGKRNIGLVFKDTVPAGDGPFCTPRSLVMTGALLEALRPEDMSASKLPYDAIALETMTAWMGPGDAAVLNSHIKVGAELPEPEEVWKDPTGTKVPERVDGRFIMIVNLGLALARSVSDTGTAPQEDRVAASLKYLSEFEEDLQVVFVTSLMSQAPKAMASPAFASWAMENQKLILSANAL